MILQHAFYEITYSAPFRTWHLRILLEEEIHFVGTKEASRTAVTLECSRHIGLT